MSARLELIALPGLPLVEPGNDLAPMIIAGYTRAGLAPADDDVVIVAQKIVSKAENRYARLSDVTASPAAVELAAKAEKDPRIVELMLRESKAVLRHRPGAVIVEHQLGYVHANAGIDQSNIRSDDTDPRVLLLPEDPDRSARDIRDAIRKHCGADVAVIINDSAGRAWRKGVEGFAIGAAGIEALRDMVGHPDLFGRPLAITQIAVADELAAAGSLLMGQADEASPVVIARGVRFRRSDEGARVLVRPRSEDLFR